jgi:hypothetical protein
MKTLDFRSRRQNGGLFRRVVKRTAIGPVADQVQRALFNVGPFGPGTDALIISSLFLLISIFHQGPHAGSEKGVI